MKKSTMFHLLAVLQMLLAVSSARAYARSGSGLDVALLLASGAVAVICEIRARQMPRDERFPRADPRFLRKVVFTFGSVGVASLALLVYRVLALGTTLGESTNLILAAICFVGLGYGIPAMVGLWGRSKPDSP